MPVFQYPAVSWSCGQAETLNGLIAAPSVAGAAATGTARAANVGSRAEGFGAPRHGKKHLAIQALEFCFVLRPWEFTAINNDATEAIAMAAEIFSQ